MCIYIIVLYNSLNDIFLCRRYKNIRKMISTYITECGSKGPASLSVSLSVDFTHRLTSASLSVLDRETDLNNTHIYIYIYTIVLYNSLNNLFLCRRYKNIMKMDSPYITEYGYNGPVSQSASLSVGLSILYRQTNK